MHTNDERANQAAAGLDAMSGGLDEPYLDLLSDMMVNSLHLMRREKRGGLTLDAWRTKCEAAWVNYQSEI